MSLTKSNAMAYIEATKPSKVTKSGVRIISDMTTPRILFYVSRKHKTGLLWTGNFVMLSYLAYDKLPIVNMLINELFRALFSL